MTLETIKNDPTFQQVLKDSFGGIMYDVDNYDKYDAKHILEMWNNLPQEEKNVADGIVTGAINFLQGN